MSKRRRTENEEEESNSDAVSNSDASNSLVQRSSLPAVLEPSIFGIEPTNDFVRAVGDFLFLKIGQKDNIEIEAKLGVLMHKQTRERIDLLVDCETVINHQDDRWMFESNMSLEQHKNFNILLNNRFNETKSPSHKGQPIEYKHTYEIDKFYQIKSRKIRVTSNRNTGEIVEGGIVEKVRVADLNIYSPRTKLDYRISVSKEIPIMEIPKGQHVFERNKDRLSYTHQIVKVDLTQVKVPTHSAHAGARGSQDLIHELEVEFIDPRILIEEKQKIENRQDNRYLEIVEHFLNNIRLLAKYV